MLGDFADGQEAGGGGEGFDESAEVREANDFAEVGLADFGGGGDVANHLQSGIAASAAGREDVHGSVCEDVDLDARGLDDGLDLLAARTDEVADLVLGNLQLKEARSVGGNLCACFAERLLHGVENLQAGFFRLGQCFAPHRNADAQNLDVHLPRGDTCASGRDFEVPVARVDFLSGDLPEYPIL